MAEIDIGQHCAFLQCHQLDFLPYECKFCEKIFCKVHKERGAHECETKLPEEQPRIECGVKTGKKCCVESCEKRELTDIKCPFCNQVTCLQHRHQSDHSCPEAKPTVAAAPKVTSKQTPAVTLNPKKKLNAKARATAAKVNLMKLKMNAEGQSSIPQNERVYFLVNIPDRSSLPMFFSREWPFGKVIDVISAAAKLPNANNVAGAQKLRLCDDEGVDIAPQTLVKELLDNESHRLYNGSNIFVLSDESQSS